MDKQDQDELLRIMARSPHFGEIIYAKGPKRFCFYFERGAWFSSDYVSQIGPFETAEAAVVAAELAYG